MPQPPPGRLPFLLLLARIVGNPMAGWGARFLSRAGGGLSRPRPADGVHPRPGADPDGAARRRRDYSKSPTHNDILGEGGGQGLLIAEGEHWRWQRRVLAPLFRAEDVAAYVPAFVAACAPPLARWSVAEPGAVQAIDADMTAATLQVLENTVLGTGLSAEDHRLVAAAATSFLKPAV